VLLIATNADRHHYQHHHHHFCHYSHRFIARRSQNDVVVQI